MMMMLRVLLAQGQPPAPLQPLPEPEIPQVFLPPAPPPMWIYVAAGGVLLLLLTLVLWLLLRPRAPSAVPPARPWQDALRALRKVRDQAASQPPGVTSAEVSEILRRYFLVRYGIPAPFRTTKEIFHEGGIPATSQRLHKYAGLADLWDQLSFSPVPASEKEATELVGKAIAHLEEDRP